MFPSESCWPELQINLYIWYWVIKCMEITLHLHAPAVLSTCIIFARK
jgi:hypothetical protein